MTSAASSKGPGADLAPTMHASTTVAGPRMAVGLSRAVLAVEVFEPVGDVLVVQGQGVAVLAQGGGGVLVAEALLGW